MDNPVTKFVLVAQRSAQVSWTVNPDTIELGGLSRIRVGHGPLGTVIEITRGIKEPKPTFYKVGPAFHLICPVAQAGA